MRLVGPLAIWRSGARLADGREIVYYDESPGSGRAEVADTRDLPGADAGPGPGMRWDPLAGEWVLVAAARQHRPVLLPVESTAENVAGTGRRPPTGEAEPCPLCPSAPGRPTEVPAGSYDVVVFENRFPALRGGVPAGADAGELAARGAAPGRCEVVCFTDRHDAALASLTPRRVRTVVEAWADRTAVLGELAAVRQVYCFENRGAQIGVTLHHPHGQVYGFPFAAPRTARMLHQARSYAQARGGRNLFDDLVANETSAGVRVVAANEHWTAFVPEAARWPYEVRLFPVPRVPDLPALSEAQRDAFGEVYLAVLRGMDRIFGAALPYIAAWHQAPTARADRDAEALGKPGLESGGDRALFGAHLQVFSVQRAPGKLKYLAGTESGMGVWINDIEPETAARTLREAM